MKKSTIYAAVLVVAAISGYWAYESYQEQQRMKAWESLLSGDECDVCAARKASMTKKQADRKAKETEAQTDANQSGQ